MEKSTFVLLVIGAVLATLLINGHCQDYRPPCGTNEEWSECKAGCEKSCDNVARMEMMICTLECKPGCICKSGCARKAKGKECILEKSCPCKKNATYKDCTYKDCRRTCDDVTNMGEAVTNKCSEECEPGCTCNKGYVFNSGQCILEKDCPCQQNAAYTGCTNCARTCDDVTNMGKPVAKKCPEKCSLGCTCNKGYVLHSGQCILEKDCPCQQNATYTVCANCPRTCDDVTNMGKPVTKKCPEKCILGCTCKKGYVLHSGQCILEKDCPCQQNSAYTGCTNCRRTCDDVANMGEPVVKVCTEQCDLGCTCNEGYVFNSGECILEADCPCHKNASYTGCTNCARTCDDVTNMGKPFMKVCTKKCALGCTCNKGYVLYSAQCILEKDCPCPANAHYDECGTGCPFTCENYTASASSYSKCPTDCGKGCFCDKGFVKMGEKGECADPKSCAYAG